MLKMSLDLKRYNQYTIGNYDHETGQYIHGQ